MVNEHVWGCICGHSKYYGIGDIVSTHDYAHCSSFLLISFGQAEVGKSIYFRSGRSEADDSLEVYHINRQKEIIGDAFQKLAKGIPVLRSCAKAFTVRNQTTWVFE